MGALGAAAFVAVVLTASCGSEPVDGVEQSDTTVPDSCATLDCVGGTVCVDGTCVPGSTCVDEDGDGYGEGCELGPDCDDTRADVNPGRPEICSGVDDDCDFFIDEGNVCAPCVPECELGESFCSGNGVTRCDDSSGCPIFGRPEPCGAGEDCRAGVCVEACVDADGDGFFADCGRPRDCDDTRADVYPGAPEVCDGVDNNCDGRVDENFVCDEPCEDVCAEGATTCAAGGRATATCSRGPDGCLRFADITPCGPERRCSAGACVSSATCMDADGDGYGPACANGDDCRDTDPLVNPGAAERCNGVDDNCNGLIDEGGVCSPCPAAAIGAPVATEDGAITRVACGGAEYVTLTGASGRVVAIVQGDPAMTADLGVIENGTFRVTSRGGRVGTATGFVADASGGQPHVLRVTAPAGTAYAIAHNNPATACRAEATEPNNSPLEPSRVGSGIWSQAAWICGGDFDFYSVRVRPGEVIDASIVFDDQAPGNIIVSIWRNGTEETPSFGGEEGPTTSLFGRFAHWRADLPGDYVVGVRGLGPGVEKAYAMTLRVLPTVACQDDRFESTDDLDNDAIATARSVRIPGSLDGVLCPGDYDVYDLGTLRAGGFLDGTFTSPASGVRARALLGGWSAPRDFPTGISSNGRYYLVVYGVDANATGTYSLSWQTR